MRYNVLSDNNISTNFTQQVLKNRGIAEKDLAHYMNTTDNDINEPEGFGEEKLRAAAALLVRTISENKNAFIIVDADCDGYTSSAILINYLYNIFPAWVTNHLTYFLHSAKQHGLSDCIEQALKYNLVICPDSSSNDFEYHKRLKDAEIPVIVLDHHEADKISSDAIVINNQLSDYPNKELSGAGVTWQFCRYLDKLLKKEGSADEFLDLVALGNMADMMSLKSIETKHLIHKGFKEKNIRNPFIFSITEKNSYSLSKGDYESYDELRCSPMGAAFFVAPFVNAMVRSGTQEEKELLFSSMLKFKAFQMIPSTKRGHAFGELERVVDQAVRTCTNVKNRQTKAQDAGMELLENKIQKNNLLEHKVLLFLLEPGEINRNIAGLVANKLMAKYQRPVAILTKVEEEENNKIKISYQGSARGYDASGITNFKDICAAAPGCIFAEGHQGAFGLGIGYDYSDAEEISGDFIYQFLDYTDEALKDMSSEPVYTLDFLIDEKDLNPTMIFDIAQMNDYWGKDMDRALVGIKCKVNKNNFFVMKSNTLKITLPNGVSALKFGGTDDEIEKFSTDGCVNVIFICKCNLNKWNGITSAQLMIEDYEITEIDRYMF